MLEQMSRELSELSSAYSAKCLENSLLDEKLAEMMAAVADSEDDRSRYYFFNLDYITSKRFCDPLNNVE